MKYAHIYILFFMSSISSVYADNAIRFSDLLDQAMSHNHQLKIKDNNIEIFNIEKKVKFRELYLPNLNWNLLAEDKKIKGCPFTSDHAVSDTPLTYASELAVSFNVFNGFTDYYQYKGSLLSYGLQKTKKSQELQDMIFRLKTLYYNLSLELNKIKILLEQLQSAKTLQNAAKVRYKKGLIPKVDLERSRIEYLDNSDQLILQKEKVKSVRLEMAKIIQDEKSVAGKIVDLPYLDLEGDLRTELNEIKKMGDSKASENFYSEYLSNGVDLKTLKTQNHVNQFSAKAAKGAYYPKFNLKLAHRYDFENNYSRLWIARSLSA